MGNNIQSEKVYPKYKTLKTFIIKEKNNKLNLPFNIKCFESEEISNSFFINFIDCYFSNDIKNRYNNLKIKIIIKNNYNSNNFNFNINPNDFNIQTFKLENLISIKEIKYSITNEDGEILYDNENENFILKFDLSPFMNSGQEEKKITFKEYYKIINNYCYFNFKNLDNFYYINFVNLEILENHDKEDIFNIIIKRNNKVISEDSNISFKYSDNKLNYFDYNKRLLLDEEDKITNNFSILIYKNNNPIDKIYNFKLTLLFQ